MRRASLELSMIVKNGGATLARCLESVRPLVDMIRIGDTGSTDESAKIARSFGAEVFPVIWKDDFARARNAVLERSTCDWILVLDADEMLDAEAATAIPALLRRVASDVDGSTVGGYAAWSWNYVRERYSRSGELAALPNPVRVAASAAYPAYTSSVKTVLFRRRPELRFEHRVHETVSGSLKRLGWKTAEAPFVIHHFGCAEDADEVRDGKNRLYQRLGREKILADPQDFAAHFELGLSLLEHDRDPASAWPLFERSAAMQPLFAAGWVFAGICLTRMGRAAEGLERLRQAEALGTRTAVFHEAMGDALFPSEKSEEAARHYRLALEAGGAPALLECKLGAAEVRAGQGQEGVKRMRAAIALEPEFVELYGMLTAGALLAGERALAVDTAEKRLTLGKLRPEDVLVAAELQAACGNRLRGMEILRDGMEQFEDGRLRKALSALGG